MWYDGTGIRTAAGVTGVAVALSLFVTTPALATTIDRGEVDVAPHLWSLPTGSSRG
jgi:hypothetical protein